MLMTPFHNMALMSPATTEADVDRHTEVFGEAVEALFGTDGTPAGIGSANLPAGTHGVRSDMPDGRRRRCDGIADALVDNDPEGARSLKT